MRENEVDQNDIFQHVRIEDDLLPVLGDQTTVTEKSLAALGLGFAVPPMMVMQVLMAAACCSPCGQAAEATYAAASSGIRNHGFSISQVGPTAG
jgi:hypothetical protein